MKPALIFDIDGTLLDSSMQDEEIYKRAVETVLGPVSFRDGLHDYEHVTDTGILLQVFDDNELVRDDRAIARIRQEFCRLISEHISASGPFPEIPGARRLLAGLRHSARHHLAIATGGWRDSARTKLEAAGFELGGIPLVSADDALERMAIMQLALESGGPDIDSVTYFGDGPWDRIACDRLGWEFRPVGPTLNGLLSFDGILQEFDL